MNPHYHPYGAGPELTSPHPPSPDNYPSSHGPHPHMLSSNGHGIGLLGHPGRPHSQLLHQHHQHHAFNNGGGPPSSGQHHQHINNNNNNGSVKICSGCGEKIIERYFLHALDGYWHNSCLKCSVCHAMLADMGSSCFTRDNMILCKDDYGRMFGSGACSACGQKIPASEHVMRSGVPPSPGQGGQRGGQQGGGIPTHHVFHLKCFACSKCGVQLMPGDRYYMLAGSLVCEQDWHKLLKNSAAAPTVRKGKVGRPRRSRD
ncbi:LIM domain transcription factor LMO4-B [Agrilus planipennis]|uniref:LIM domain transcription factor LMO4-B n=1 Tax=Agrilus planipennis TaxID=224129 RepID=A0A1W4XTL5_AGRPL|nr:LIM domain transcription factor LMO4-B [Agrilus planipennis]